MEVRGFDKPVSDRAKPTILLEPRTPTMATVVEETRNRELGSAIDVEAETMEFLAQTSMDVERSSVPQSGGGMARSEETTTQQKIPEFEDYVRDINDTANAAPVFTISSAGDSEIHADNIGKDQLLSDNTTLLLDLDSGS